MFFSKTRICIPLVVVMVFDLMLTMIGQLDGYWLDYAKCNEASPVGRFFLAQGPAHFVASFLLYQCLFLCCLMKIRRFWFKIFLATGVFIAHAICSSSWLPDVFLRFEDSNWYWSISYGFILGSSIAFCVGNMSHNTPSASA